MATTHNEGEEFLLEIWRKREQRLELSSAPWKAVRTGPLLRHVLISRMIRAALAERFHVETICLAVQIVDRFIHKKQLDVRMRRNLGLVVFTSLWIAMKYEEVEILHVADIVSMAPDRFAIADMVAMESEILDAIDYRIASSITFWPFFQSLLRRTGSDITIGETVWKSILPTVAYVDTPPSIVAACLLFHARSGYWDETCVSASGGLTQEILQPIVDRLMLSALTPAHLRE